MSKISELVAFLKSNPDPTILKEVNFGIIPNFQAQQIAASTGVRVKSALKVLNSYGIIHTLKRHGNNTEEQKRGQSGVTDADFEQIPIILTNPDNITRGQDGKKGKKALIFTKLIGSKTYYLIMSVFVKGQEIILEVDTMYKKN